MAKNKLSPMMQQYLEIKAEYEDCILFFRLGDFYEMFYDDAKIASRELELTLTGKNCGQEERAPMCGVPFHSADTYIARLVEKGYKVAICEQIEDPAEAKGIVKREVIQIITPGTVTSQSMLNEKENNYLASVYLDKRGMSVSYCDISTGELYTTEENRGLNLYEDLLNELVKINAKEIMINQEFAESYDQEEIKAVTGGFLFVMNDAYYNPKSAKDSISAQFNGLSMTALGLDGRDLCIMSLGALLAYLLETQKQNLAQLTRCQFYELGKHMSLDKATLRNLEITETLYDKRVQGSLLGVLDKTATAMGSRKLKQWLREPLNNAVEINGRLDAVEVLTENPMIENNIREALKQVYDFERLAGRIASGSANGKDLIALKSSVRVLPEIKESLSYGQAPLLELLSERIHDLSPIYDLIESAICDDPPFTIKDGGIIKEGWSEELDSIKYSIKDGKQWIVSLEATERERTGIKNLKVGFNKVFGYYIDVTKSNTHLVPEDYIRKQTLVNNERYITPELKEMESLVLNAETKINQLEYELFTNVRLEIQKYIREIQETSQSIAQLDVLCSFARVSSRLGYVKPVIDESYELRIEKGRHPVIEQMTGGGLFVSNDTYLNNTDTSMLVITGPNMAGKSTYMRQTALIVLMAQAGCFVPCESAKIGVVDRIFTRIGASDNLAQGQSTFFVEMSELAYILSCAQDRSLIILDEIGRGTSTYDGLSIAWAAVEYLCNDEKHIRTLFATHYHELTVLEDQIKGVQNLNVDVSEENGNIVFLHKIIPGSASRSYGIHVAKLAGIPSSLLHSARAKLECLEENSAQVSLTEQTQSAGALSKGKPEEEQISFFIPQQSPVVEKLKKLDLMDVTPSQAIRILEELKEEIDD
ncbi:DNA mismatch repair protein MutS [Ihubacter sp. mB4P-1]|uniref:DNA mismatch repair protein MutS n=1 Tax=Ihubacter sp. mB4P-1 TaxID=3242370 RepID=UPI003C7CC694